MWNPTNNSRRLPLLLIAILSFLNITYWTYPNSVTFNQFLQIDIIPEQEVGPNRPNKTAEILQRFSDRRKHVENICDKYRSNVRKLSKQKTVGKSMSRVVYAATNHKMSQRLHLQSFVMERSRHVMYCWIHKVSPFQTLI